MKHVGFTVLTYIEMLSKNSLKCNSLQMMIFYTRNPKDSTKKLLELIKEFNKVAGYKVNI